MTATVTIELGTATPVYEQIRSQLAGAITGGQLAGGTRLPSVRALAADLGIAVNTVVRAYAELEASGFIVNRRGSGAVVADPGTATPPSAIAAAGRLAAVAATVGLTTDQVIDLVRSAMLAARANTP